MKFLFPWQGFLTTQLGSVLKSVVVGLVSTAFLIVLGWSVFASSEDLDDRSPISVLINPDYRVIPATKAKLIEIGTCSEQSYSKPETETVSSIFESTVCRNWQLRSDYWVRNWWTATQFRHIPARPSFERGSTRIDAASESLSNLGRVGKNLLVPIGVLIALNFGVSIGYWFQKRDTTPPQHRRDG
jgi:hypothetical protein